MTWVRFFLEIWENSKFWWISVPFEADNNIGTIKVNSDGSLRPWYLQPTAKQDMNDSMMVMMSATPNPTDAASDDDKSNDHDHPLIFNGTWMPSMHGSFSPYIIYDHHHHDVPMMTTTTTTTEEPVKRKELYSHYPLRLKFWYFNMAFAFWFIWYCVYLMMKSLGRHKVWNKKFNNRALYRGRGEALIIPT